MSVVESNEQDALFHQAVQAIDAGDVNALEAVLDAHPRLVHQRLEQPGAWLRERVGGALDGFFERPYLLWFVADDPVRNGTLPSNIGDVTRAIILRARHEGGDTLAEQLDYALRLVCWSWIARECGVQIELIDVLLDAAPPRTPSHAAWRSLRRRDLQRESHGGRAPPEARRRLDPDDRALSRPLAGRRPSRASPPLPRGKARSWWPR